MQAQAEQTVEYLQSWDKLRELQKLPKLRGINGYCSLDDFILRNGRAWQPGPKPEAIRWGTIKECYRNASLLAIDNPERYIYCEGYAMGLIPVMHAWVIDNDNGSRVIDNTWRTQGTEYFGVAIRLQYLTKCLHKNKHYGLIDRWENGWPMLRADPADWRHPIMVVETTNRKEMQNL